ncbi:MAG TPA: DUF1737 domain-containing protein [bacterium]|nr:DUF1737 domain-containing protein [bacterium]
MVREISLDTLEKRITEHLESGWELQGAPFYYPVQGDPGIEFAQALARTVSAKNSYAEKSEAF